MDRVDWKSVLKDHSIFASLSRKEIDDILRVSEQRQFNAGERIVTEGEFGDSIFLIGAGSVEVTLRWGAEQSISLGVLQPGEFFGEMAIYENFSRRSASVSAKTDCEVLEIKGKDFLALAAEHHEIEATVIGKLTAHLRDVHEQVIKIKVKNLDERIELLNTRLDSQQQAADATLKAAHTVFEQTNRRANEIIDSADRTRHRFVQTASVFGTFVGVVITVLGVLGWNELNDIQSISSDMEEQVRVMDKQVSEFENQKKRLNEDMARLRDETLATAGEIEETSSALEDARMFSQEISQIQTAVRETSAAIVRNILLHAYREAVTNGRIHVAEELFRSARDLSPADPPLSIYLAEVEIRMGEVGEQPIDYAPLLQSVHRVARGADRVQANYLLLVNAIINGRDGIQRDDPARTYEQFMQELEKSLGGEKHQFRFAPGLVTAMSREPADNARACKLLRLVPPMNGITAFCAN